MTGQPKPIMAPAPLPAELDLFVRVSRIEMLLLELTKHVAPQCELSLPVECAIEELKRLHPHV